MHSFFFKRKRIANYKLMKCSFIRLYEQGERNRYEIETS